MLSKSCSSLHKTYTMLFGNLAVYHQLRNKKKILFFTTSVENMRIVWLIVSGLRMNDQQHQERYQRIANPILFPPQELWLSSSPQEHKSPTYVKRTTKLRPTTNLQFLVYFINRKFNKKVQEYIFDILALRFFSVLLSV